MLLFYTIVFLLAFVLTWIIRVVALKRRMLDIPNQRSSHSVPTPRGGGVAIGLVWFAGLVVLYALNKIETKLFLALMCAIPLFVVGMIDDVLNLKPAPRFVVQALSAAGALFFLGGLGKLSLGFACIQNVWLLTPLAFAGLLWMTNLYNFLDGIDGYAAMQTIFVTFCMFVIFNSHPALLMLFATLGFLIWNWQKAKIFMGDAGSTTIGFTLGVLTIYLQNAGLAPLLFCLLLTSLFWFDATLTLLRRAMRREKLSEAHRKHAYQRWVLAGHSHAATVVVAQVLNLLALTAACAILIWPEYMLWFFLTHLFVLYLITRFVDHKKPFDAAGN